METDRTADPSYSGKAGTSAVSGFSLVGGESRAEQEESAKGGWLDQSCKALQATLLAEENESADEGLVWLRVFQPDGALVGRLSLSAEEASRQTAQQTYYESKLKDLRSQLERADNCAAQCYAEQLAAVDTLQQYVERCNELVAATKAAQARTTVAETELSSVKHGFDDQVGVRCESMPLLLCPTPRVSCAK